MFNSNSLFVLSFFVWLSVLIPAFSQNPELDRYREQRRAEMDEMVRKRNAEMEALRKMYDDAFAERMREQWEFTTAREEESPFRRYSPAPRQNQRSPIPATSPLPKSPETPKPPVPSGQPAPERIPAAPAKIESDDTQIPNPFPEVPSEPDSEQEDIMEIVPLTPRGTAFTFFGLNLIKPNALPEWPVLSQTVDERALERWYKAAVASPYRNWLDEVLEARKKNRLDDWTYYQYLLKLANSFSKSDAERELWIWFALVESGFDAILAYTSQGNVYHAVQLSEKVYGRQFLVKGNNRYVLPEHANGESYFTYRGQHEYASSKLSPQSIGETVSNGKRAAREFNFSALGKAYSLSLEFSADRVDLYQTLPMFSPSFYFSLLAGERWPKENKKVFQDILADIPEPADKVRFLHAMVTYGIPYKTDEEQFGFEKWGLSEEALYFPYADCEDRTFLLNRLIRDLLRYKTIGLHFKGNPGHIAMAVLIPGAKNMDVYEYANARYVYVDPTFFNADIGIIPDSYKNQVPSIFY